MTAAASIAHDIELVKDAVHSVNPPAGVALRRIYFSEDHAGARAVYVVYTNTVEKGFGPARMQQIHHFDRAVTDAVYATQIDRIVYTRFEDKE